ncbi:MAG: Crp/Fnr family transcriptional regulator [Chloroflexota bacterium]
MQDISPLVIEREKPAGDVIVWQGQQDDVLYFVISGLVKLFATSAEGREFIVRLVYGGDSLNGESILNKEPNELSAMAMSPAVIYGLSRQDLNRILSTHPEIQSRIVEVFADHQRYLVRLATELVFKNVTSRLARLLLEREKLASTGGETRITQQDMAFMIGTVREIVSRSLRELESQGAISIKHNQIIITDRHKLSTLSEL